MEVTVAMQKGLRKGNCERVEFQIEEMHNQSKVMILGLFLKSLLISSLISSLVLRVFSPVITVVPVGLCRELMTISGLLPFITQSSNQQFNFLLPEGPSVVVSILDSNFS